MILKLVPLKQDDPDLDDLIRIHNAPSVAKRYAEYVIGILTQ